MLDLGCGPAMSSVFLRREFGVQVWATDLWQSPSENLQRVRDAGVFPIHADARSLPFAEDFFDAIVSVGCFYYFGTDDHYLNYLARFVKPGGPVGIANAGMVREIEAPFPSICANGGPMTATSAGACIRRPGGTDTGKKPASWPSSWPTPCPMAGSCGWTGIGWSPLTMPWKSRRLEADRGNHLNYVRVVGRRQDQAKLLDPVVSLPAEYTKKPLLRSEQ